jgi:hypothetical protein
MQKGKGLPLVILFYFIFMAIILFAFYFIFNWFCLHFRYNSLLESGKIFDVVVPTTSTKQAVANILSVLDFQWVTPKWDEIKKIVEEKSDSY